MSRFLTTLVSAITGAPRITLVLLGLVTIVAGYYAATQFRVNADQTSLIAPNAEFQVRYDAFRDAFPTYKRTTLVVIEAKSRPAAAAAARDLAAALSAQTTLFRDVFTTAALPFFQQNGLLYQPTRKVAQELDTIAQAQPGIAIVARDMGLEGALNLLRQGATEAGNQQEANPALLALAQEITRAARATADDAASTTQRFTLGDMAAAGGDTAIELIAIQIREDQTDFLSPRAKLDAIHATATQLGITPENGFRVRLTGNIPLSVDELRQVRDSLGLAGALSVAMLALVLGFGVRSGRIVAVMFIALALGGIWTMAWAMASIGEVNLLSASFAILFVGLGIDFAIHLALRAQEDVEGGMATRPALVAAAGDVGPAIALGALTSAIGFLSFLPTEYKGFADLGVIAGGGMALALIAALTVIPASLSILGGIPAHRRAGAGFATMTGRLFAGIRRHARLVTIASFAIGITAAAISTQASFDFSTLSLKNAKSEPLQTLADLQERGLATDYAAYVVAPSLAAAEPIAAKLEALPAVARVQTAHQLIPADQDEKLAMIADTAFLLFPVLPLVEGPDAATPDDLTLPVPPGAGSATRDTYATLETTLQSLTPVQLDQLNIMLASQIRGDLKMMVDVLKAEPVTNLEQVPTPLRARFISPGGEALVIGLPLGDVTGTAELRTFVGQIRSLFPESTGRAVVEAIVGDVVVNAFMTALLLALGAVTLIILLATRSFVDTALILMPLLLAAVATTATGVLIGMPFNQANIIVLPLIMGLGVDNGIHVLLRYRQDGSLDNLLASSTPRAIILSTLTTIGAFGALSVSTHAGTASIGILLTIAMGYLLVATMFVLPAMLSLRTRAPQHP